MDGGQPTGGSLILEASANHPAPWSVVVCPRSVVRSETPVPTANGGPPGLSGGGDGIRTHGLYIANVALCQLSYTPGEANYTCWRSVSRTSKFAQFWPQTTHTPQASGRGPGRRCLPDKSGRSPLPLPRFCAANLTAAPLTALTAHQTAQTTTRSTGTSAFGTSGPAIPCRPNGAPSERHWKRWPARESQGAAAD